MSYEYKVTTIELSKRMVKLGWDYETERCWVLNKDGEYDLWWTRRLSVPKSKNMIPAPDAIEIAILFLNDFKIVRYRDKYLCKRDSLEQAPITEDNNLSECLGKMWCYLRERKLI